ncbi:hypothetical protein [Mucilaginibacter ginsenosidivorans]|uniref:Uncharacterized protein n=1 Tax=Mucilaginibacter ginsenosidivorans TaxID=398053 RepID=A0A5B8UQM0_9SPHI|nr:hypothetical protein [Mucilaginibacter ginsenosidivorans]QEC61413.1 hypothetical protein FRZ54_02045 [Mucilaginibacter ginsenosidivorans]
MPNILFHYLYRNSGNYKKYDFVIFTNPDNVNLSELEGFIKSKLIWSEWFYAEDWKLPELFLPFFDFRIDPTWHEFESVEYTDEVANSPITLAEFMEVVNNTKQL